jgi:phospholipid/cholesterol/gamma-HCH transport system substrate-binding protein
MPRTRSLAWTELKIGLLSIFAIVVASIFIFLLGGQGGFFWQQYSLKSMFTNTAGLKEGAPVRVAGVEVGSVEALNFVGDKVEVVMKINEDMRPRITSTSTASLGSVSLLGEAAVDITASSGGSPIPEWGYIPSGRPVGSITDVATQASEGIEAATRLLVEVGEGRGTVGKLFTDETLYRQLNRFVVAAQEVADTLRQGQGTIGRLAQDPAAARSLEASLANLEAVTARIRAGQGSLGQLLNDDALSKSVTSATANLDKASANIDAIAGRLNRGEGTAGKLVSDPQLYNRLNSMADRLDKVTEALQQGQGTAGQLLHDRQLYENMNGAVNELRSLVKDIRADPKKYLNVRVSLF